MPDASYFRDKAKRYRELSKQAINPEIRDQLVIWAEEFADKAETIERKEISSRSRCRDNA